MLIVPTLLVLVFVLLIAEALYLRRCRSRIPVRIHVNGTRGKSSVTEYVAAGLRGSGRSVFAKVTGILPTIFLPDESVSRLQRRGPARVQEQAQMLRTAARLGVDALVLECMSIAPEFQRLESRLLEPTIYVITNIRDDHKEEMGLTISEQAEAICSAIPHHADVVTAEEKHLHVIEHHAKHKNARVHFVPADRTTPIDRDHPGIMRVNIALAAKVCELARSEPAKATSAINAYAESKRYDSVNLELHHRIVKFINGFAVNDPPSADEFLRHWKEHSYDLDSFVVILNTRSDRPLRTKDFVRWLSHLPGLTSIVLIGTHVPYARQLLLRNGIEAHRISMWSRLQVEDPHRALLQVVQNETAVIGFGNIAGDGFTICDALHGVTAGVH